LYGILMVALYDTIANIEGFAEVIQNYPPELMAFFGGSDMLALTTSKGYLDVYYFSYMSVIVGIFAVIAGGGLLVSDEEKGILDLVMAHPISRTGLFWGRVLGFVVATVVILLVSWLSWAIPAGGTGMDLTWIEFLRPFIPLLASLVLFGMLALLLSMVVPSARFASMISAGLLVANYLVLGLANINTDLQTAVEYTPLYYYQGGKAIDGLNWRWLAGLLVAALVLALLAWWRFLRRDIRVGGEGGWRLPRLSFRRKVGAQPEA
jgi:ABC-2 type transport system permease protein